MRKNIMRRRMMLLSLSVLLVGLLGGASVATGSVKKAHASADATITYGPSSPTFVGPAATGCTSSGCSLLTGPFTTSSTASSSSTTQATASPNAAAGLSGPYAMPAPTTAGLAARILSDRSHARGSAQAAAAPTPVIPGVRCQPLAAGCNSISTSAAGATGVKGLNAVDSAEHSTLIPPPGLPVDVETARPGPVRR